MQINPISSILATATGSLTASILAGATTTLSVTFSFGTAGIIAFPDTSYTTSITPSGSQAILGGYTYSVTSKTTTGCTITVKNTGLVSLSLTALALEVIAIYLY